MKGRCGGGGGAEKHFGTTMSLSSRRAALAEKVATALRLYEEERERQLADIKQAVRHSHFLYF